MEKIDIKKVNSIIAKLNCRPRNQNNEPGGLIEIPPEETPIIVGDLHSNLYNLKMILKHNNNLPDIKKRKKTLIILGDAIHNDQIGHIKEMQSSLEILEFIFQLILDNTNKIIYLRGNHDTFDERLVKNSIQQGKEFKEYLLEKRGKEYIEDVTDFFNILPVFVLSKYYVITHAGPIRRGITRDELININNNKDNYHQLMWNRINEFRGTPSLKEYAEDDIKKTLGKLKLSKNTHFIVGHNPLWNNGNRTGVWLNVLGIKNHHIIYSGSQTRAPYLTFKEKELIIHHAIEPKSEVLYV